MRASLAIVCQTLTTQRLSVACLRWSGKHGQQLRQAPIITGAMTRSEGIITFGLAIIAQARLGNRLQEILK